LQDEGKKEKEAEARWREDGGRRLSIARGKEISKPREEARKRERKIANLIITKDKGKRGEGGREGRRARREAGGRGERTRANLSKVDLLAALLADLGHLLIANIIR